VLATTYLDEAERCASVLVLDSGRALASGTAETIVAAMPGSLRAVPAKPEGEAAVRAWRRAGTWRVWDPGDAVAGAGHGQALAGDLITPDLQDAVTVAALAWGGAA
jgi:ABC-2 type transport system ATP-binding protein